MFKPIERSANMADGQEKEAGKKKSIGEKARRLFLAGVVTTGIMLGGIGASRAAQFEYMIEPPVPQQAYYLTNYKEGWNALMKGHDLFWKGEVSKGYFDKAIKYFEKEKKKNAKMNDWDRLCLHYILDYCCYIKAGDEGTSAKAEMHLKKAIELATADYEKFKGSKDGDEIIFLDLVISSYRNIGYTYFIEGGGKPEKGMSIDTACLTIAKENFQKALVMYKKYKKELDRIDEMGAKDFERVGQYLKRIDQLLGEKEEQAKKF